MAFSLLSEHASLTKDSIQYMRTSNATLHADTITGAINCFDNLVLYNQTKRTMYTNQSFILHFVVFFSHDI